MESGIFWRKLSIAIDLPFDIDEVIEIESNCNSVWIELNNGMTYFISLGECEKEGNESEM